MFSLSGPKNQMLTGKRNVGLTEENVDRSMRCWTAREC